MKIEFELNVKTLESVALFFGVLIYMVDVFLSVSLAHCIWTISSCLALFGLGAIFNTSREKEDATHTKDT